ncbi:unnamed protein product [Sphacelaria rigidula]
MSPSGVLPPRLGPVGDDTTRGREQDNIDEKSCTWNSRMLLHSPKRRLPQQQEQPKMRDCGGRPSEGSSRDTGNNSGDSLSSAREYTTPSELQAHSPLRAPGMVDDGVYVCETLPPNAFAVGDGELPVVSCAGQDDSSGGNKNSGVGRDQGGNGGGDSSSGESSTPEGCGGGAGDSRGGGGQGGGAGDDDDDKKRGPGDTVGRAGDTGLDIDKDEEGGDEDEEADKFSRQGSAIQFGKFVSSTSDFVSNCSSTGRASTGRVLDGGDSGETNQVRRLSGFFRSPHSRHEPLPSEIDHSSAAHSSAGYPSAGRPVPDVDMLARIFGTAKSCASDFGEGNGGMLLRRSGSSSCLESTPKQSSCGNFFETLQSCESIDTAKDGSIVWIHRSGGSVAFDSNPQQQPPHLPPFASPSLTSVNADEEASGAVRVSPTNNQCVPFARNTDVELTGSTEGRGGTPIGEDGDEVIQQLSETKMQASGDAVAVAHDPKLGVGQPGSCGGRESEEEWLLDGTEVPALVQSVSVDVFVGKCHPLPPSSPAPPALPPRTAAMSPARPSKKLPAQDAPVVGNESAGVGGKTRGLIRSAETRQWAGLNEDGSWRSEIDRIAAGAAGAEEAERRRQAKINRDESWRLDVSGTSKGEQESDARDIRRQSVSFTRVEDGNVR